jgi:hypothetical protein
MISLGIAKGSTSGIGETTDSNNKAQEIYQYSHTVWLSRAFFPPCDRLFKIGCFSWTSHHTLGAIGTLEAHPYSVCNLSLPNFYNIVNRAFPI